MLYTELAPPFIQAGIYTHLVAIIASSIVADIASRLQHLLLVLRQDDTISSNKRVARIMSTIVGAEALDAKIIVGAGLARNGFRFLDS